VKKNLLPKLEEELPDSETNKKLEEKKNFINILDSEYDINRKLDYIFNPESDFKKEYSKIKKSNSCKCSKTNCMKFSCNCLRNGIKCDILCGCKNCDNKQKETISDLLSRKTMRD
jgi:hypothetical protein